MKTYYLDQFGCAKNQVEGETLLLHLNASGFLQADSPLDAEFIIINSCGFIEAAKKESIKAVLEYKNAYPNAKIVLCGCLPIRYEDDLRSTLHEADIIFAGKDLSGLVNNLVTDTAVSDLAVFDKNIGTRPLLSLPGSAYIKISDGCNNCCTFCAIPLIRGRLRSRSIEDICSEAKTLIERGVKELCLVAQDASSYGIDWSGKCMLNELLRSLAKIRGEFWVRLLYLHPDHFPLEILDTIKNDERFLPYFDIPFQHAADKILRAMNRRGTCEKYLDLIDVIRTKLGNAVIRSTFLTGFPGETEDDFNTLLVFQAKAKLDWAGFFTYSKEDGTPAFNLKNSGATKSVSKKIALQRKNILEEAQTKISTIAVKRFIGIKTKALVEEEMGDGLYLGRLFCHAPSVDGSAIIETSQKLKCGSFTDVEVFASSLFDLRVRKI
ncbi:MAG: 30S ribosomal protein S12 methylthiotransferase RimO [Termitinemataceae bacterium]|nr:MAG: 30S ribosomal protein S12 methylthiotransferase RimO [Termitinemataceae bacterium]